MSTHMEDDLIMRDFLKNPWEIHLENNQFTSAANEIGPWNAPSDLEDICSSRQRLQFASRFSTPGKAKKLIKISVKQSSENNGRDTHFYGMPLLPNTGRSVRTECVSNFDAEEDLSQQYQQSHLGVQSENLPHRRKVDKPFSELDLMLHQRIMAGEKRILGQNVKLFSEKQYNSPSKYGSRECKSVSVSRNASPVSWTVQQDIGKRKSSSSVISMVGSNSNNYSDEAEKRALISMAYQSSAARNSVSQIGNRSELLSKPSERSDSSARSNYQSGKNENDLPKLMGKHVLENVCESAIADEISSTQPWDKGSLSRPDVVQLSNFRVHFPNPHQIKQLDQYRVKQMSKVTQQVIDFSIGSNLLRRKSTHQPIEFSSDGKKHRENKESGNVDNNRQSMLSSFQIQFSPPKESSENNFGSNGKVRRSDKRHSTSSVEQSIKAAAHRGLIDSSRVHVNSLKDSSKSNRGSIIRRNINYLIQQQKMK